MDTTRSEDQTNKNGPSNAAQSLFDPTGLLGYSQYAAALSAASGSYPHLAGGFSLFPPPSAMFPGASAAAAASLPFGGLGSFGDSLLGSTALSDASSGSTEWWRMATERANQLAESPSGFYGNLAGSLQGSSSLCPSSVASPLPSSSANKTSSSRASHDRSPSDAGGGHRRSAASPSSSSSSRRGDAATSHRGKHETKRERMSADIRSSSSPSKSGVSNSGASTNHLHEKFELTTGPEAAKCAPAAAAASSLESSLLSAEAALLHAASPLFFPFPLPPLFGGSNPLLPFSGAPGLLSEMQPSTTSVYSPVPSVLPPLSSHSSEGRARSACSTSSKGSSSTAATVVRSPMRGTRDGDAADGGRTASAGSSHDAERSRAGSRSGKSVIVSPALSSLSEPSAPSPQPHVKQRCREKRSWQPAAHDGGGYSVDLTERHGGRDLPQPKAAHEASNHLSNSSAHDRSEPSKHTSSYDAMTFSDVGAIDLSVKRPCRSSPAPLPPKTSSPKTAPSKSVSMPSTMEPAQSMVDALSTLFSQQPGLSDPSALMQFLAGQQIAAANAGNIPDLSLSLATAASLFPPMFDGVSGLFYPPAVLAAMAAPSQGSDPQTSANNHGEKSKGRGRGRRRGGGRGARSSSMFISNLFTQQSPGSSHGNEVKVGRGRGSRGRQSKGRGRQQAEPLPGSLLDLERQRYFEQMLHDQSATPSLAHGTSSGKESRASSRLSKSATALTSHESLTNKMLHQQSKLAQALTGDVCHTLASSEPVLNTSTARAASDHQDGNNRDHRTGLMHTDSEFGNEDTSSACSTDSEADGHSVLGSEADHAATGARGKRKQESTSDGDGLPVKKRRRTILDETILRLPLGHGWQRETRVRSFTPRKIVGEVLYITPCDRKLRNYNEVDKFLEKNGDGTLTRENFSFSTKVNVGHFYEQCVSSEGTKWVQMSDDNVAEKYVVIEERKKRIIENKMRAQLREEKRQKSEEMLSKLAEQRLQRRLEQQELARKVAEMKMRKKAEKEHQREMLHRARQLRVMEVRRMKERQKMARQQERYHRQMQLRMERELRSRQMIEEKEVRRQQDVALKEQERERRRLDLLMAKALEAQKKEQEKERLKNEKKNAKKLDREKKLAQKRLEIFLAREQRRPIEDMSLQDAKPLPEFDRIPGLRLPGKAFADCLMVLEFVHNFASILGFDADSIPTLNVIQGGLLNVEGCVKEFFVFTKRLLRCAVEDPGFPNVKEGVLISGQKLTDLEIPDDAISEPLRIFIKARVGHEDEMSSRLLTTPFASLNPTHKAAILAFICNELLCNKEINAEIEKNVDHVTNLRRDKWIIEGKLRKLRVIQAQRQRKLAAQRPFTATPSAPAAGVPTEDSSNVLPASGTTDSQLNHTLPDSDADSDNDAPPPRFSLPHDSETEEDKKASLEELEAKIDKLVKQQNQLREKIFNLSHKLSAFSFGHDRYRRQYWVLTKCGGIFVEGLESGGPDSADPNAPETDALVESLSAQAVASGMETSSVSMVTETKYDTGMDVSVMSSISLPNEVKQEVNCDGDRNIGASRSYSSPKCRVQSNDFKVDADLSTVSKTELLDVQTKPLGFGMAPKNGFVDLKMASFDGVLDLKYHGNNSDEIYKMQSGSVEAARTDSKGDSIKPSFTMPSADSTNLSTCRSELNLAASTPLRTDGVPESDVAMSESLLFGAGLVPRTPSLVALQHGYPLSSSRQMSRIDTPCSDLGGSQSQFDISTADTPLSLTQPSRTSTPSHMSTTFTDDLPLAMFSADSELQPDFLAVPKNVRPISLAKQRGWWRITNPDQIKELVGCLNQRGIRERNLQKTLERYMTFACQSCSKSKKSAVKLEVTEESKRILSSPTSAPAPDDNDAWDFQLQRQIEMRVLEEIETLEERICKASLQTKGWTSLPAVTTDNSVALISSAQKLLLPNQQYIINTGRLRLLSLERNIERRYLKPPLGRSNQLNLANVSGGGTSKDNRSSSDDDSDADDETATKDMNLWRLAVNNATSAAQLSLYITQLSGCIAWEKSIMKVLCQICCRDDNEAQLLLCDICDRGYHTYCVKPKLDSIPEGDWYCHECISKASGDICCIACGLQGSRLVTCEFCSRRVHLDCLEPPIARMPKKWTCYSCSAERGKRKRSRPSTATSTPQKEASSVANSPARVDETESEKHVDVTAEAEDGMSDAEDNAKTVASEPAPQLVKERSSKSSKERKRDRHRKEKKSDDDGSVSAAGTSPACNGVPMDDMNVCKAILSEMREHTDAWPFLTPVNTKQFPTYRKVIRCPIDFQTIGRKLKTNTYKSHDEFASDTRLVFSNCEMFNEDDSLVGQAGHSMKQFFEARWAELTAGSESAMMPPQQPGS